MNLILYRLFEGPKLDMLNQFSNTANLILTAIFFHPLFPLAIPIAFVVIVVNYWANKVTYYSIKIFKDCVLATYACSRTDVLFDGIVFRKLDPLLCFPLVSEPSPFLQNPLP